MAVKGVSFAEPVMFRETLKPVSYKDDAAAASFPWRTVIHITLRCTTRILTKLHARGFYYYFFRLFLARRTDYIVERKTM